MNGRDGTTTFLPLDSKIDGPDNHPTLGQFLTREQAIYVYKMVETKELVNTEHDGTRNRTRETVR